MEKRGKIFSKEVTAEGKKTLSAYTSARIMSILLTELQSPAYLTWLHECVSLSPVGTVKEVLKVSEDSLK